ncbi:MAG: 4-phosphoerythronate dehydrogenase [Tannerellaceae bacterium]|nr:4-phosphoerythronate dehydrogenase [Tannerellaceae bacterium]
MKIVADHKIPFLRGALEPFADVVYLPGDAIAPSDLADADAILTRTRTRCDAALLGGSRVRLIATATIGYDHIDTAYCEASGIRWINAPGCNAASVQQYIAAAIVTWVNARGLRLQNLTLGVVGVGNVGSQVAKAGAALGMRVLRNDPPRADREGAETFTPLEELLGQSDIVTCHTPLTRDGLYPTYHLASGAFFAQMKARALYINSSRGAVADTAALKRALQTRLSACILDVWEGEPTIDSELLEKAFIGTPHIAGYSCDGKANGTAACVREAGRFFGLDIPPDWYPAAVPPPPMPATLHIDCRRKTREQVFFEAITHTYPVWEDSRMLKQSPGSFERLRGDYRIRREFGSFSLHLNQADGTTVDALQALGFKINGNTESI